MRRRVIAGVFLAACLAACSGQGDQPRSNSSPSSPATDTSGPSSTPSTLSPVERAEHRAYPFTTVDLRRQPTRIFTDSLPAGALPRIPWRQPGGLRDVYRLGDEVIPMPGTLLPVGRFGDGYVVQGGCTRSAHRCEGKPRDGLHLLSPDGTLTSLYLESEGRQVCCPVTSLDGRQLTWVVETPAGHLPYRVAVGDSTPSELPDPAATMRGASPRPLGFVGEDLILAVARPGGTLIDFVRTSGRPSDWDARRLSVVAPGTLLGEPAFTKDRDDCLSRYRLDSQQPRWTRCYTWGDRPVDPHGMSASPDGRWLALRVLGGLQLVDLSSGTPRQRIQYDHRLQGVRFEDEDHFLVVLSREDLPGVDPWPVYRIVRCDLELDCDRATPDIEITSYDMLSFLGD